MDRRDDDLGGPVDRVRLEPLDRVQLRELPSVVRRLEVGEFVLSLFAQIVTVDEEKDAFGPAVV